MKEILRRESFLQDFFVGMCDMHDVDDVDADVDADDSGGRSTKL